MVLKLQILHLKKMLKSYVGILIELNGNLNSFGQIFFRLGYISLSFG
jgi:hypothetical protein